MVYGDVLDHLTSAPMTMLKRLNVSRLRMVSVYVRCAGSTTLLLTAEMLARTLARSCDANRVQVAAVCTLKQTPIRHKNAHTTKTATSTNTL